MIPRTIGNFDDFFSFESLQIDPGDPGRVVSIDEKPSSILQSFRQGEFWMVGVIPRDKSPTRHQHILGFFTVAIAVFRVLRKNRNLLKKPPRGNPIDRHLSAKSPRHEPIK